MIHTPLESTVEWEPSTKAKWFIRSASAICLAGAVFCGIKIAQAPVHRSDSTQSSDHESGQGNVDKMHYDDRQQLYYAFGAVVLGISGSLGLLLPLASKHPDRMAVQYTDITAKHE